MQTKTIELGQFEKDYLIAWHVCTQCYNSAYVKLYAGSTVFFDVAKTTTSTSLQKIAMNHAFVNTTDTLYLKIDVNTPYNLKIGDVSGQFSNENGRKVGYIYNYCIEDALDNDYNDVYVNIIGWKNLKNS